MKIIRYQNAQNEIHYAALQPDASARAITGDIFGKFEVTGQTGKPYKLLAPVAPRGVGFARKPPVFLKPGDTVTIEIDQIGAFTNPVREEAI
jgi:hypothetical protein